MALTSVNGIKLQGPFREKDYNKKYRCLVIFIPQNIQDKQYVCVWKDKVLATIKHTVLSQTYHYVASREGKIRVVNASFRLHGEFQAENTQWYFYGIHGMS